MEKNVPTLCSFLSGFIIALMFSYPVQAEEKAKLQIDVTVPSPSFELYHESPPLVGKIMATATIRNVGKRELPFSDWSSCNNFHAWTTDSAFVLIQPPACIKNLPEPFVLKPGESKEIIIPLGIASLPQKWNGAPPEDIHFRLGYFGPSTFTWLIENIEPNKPLWSKEITLHPIAASLQQQEEWNNAYKLYYDKELIRRKYVN